MHVQCAGACIDTDEVAIADFTDQATFVGSRAEVNRGRHLAGRTRQTAIGDQGHAMAFILQIRQKRHELMQLRHAIGTRPLESDNGDQIAIQITGFVGFCHRRLAVENAGRCRDRPFLFIQCRNLDDGLAEIAGQLAQAALRRERIAGRAKYAFIPGLQRRIFPVQMTLCQTRLARILRDRFTDDAPCFGMQQSGRQQLANDKRHAAGRMELIDVGRAVWINTGQ